jgi:hypothetical protein
VVVCSIFYTHAVLRRACREVNEMSGQFIIVSSVTYAYKGKNALERKGYKAYIEREPKRLSDCGCHYIIRIKDMPLERAIEILKAERVKIIGTGADDDGVS